MNGNGEAEERDSSGQASYKRKRCTSPTSEPQALRKHLTHS